jgi:hypothetical protein
VLDASGIRAKSESTDAVGEVVSRGLVIVLVFWLFRPGAWGLSPAQLLLEALFVLFLLIVIFGHSDFTD